MVVTQQEMGLMTAPNETKKKPTRSNIANGGK